MAGGGGQQAECGVGEFGDGVGAGGVEGGVGGGRLSAAVRGEVNQQ